MTEKLLVLGYYSYAHEADTCQKRIKAFVDEQKQQVSDFEFIGSFSDKDLESHELIRHDIIKRLQDLYCIMVVLPGWAIANPVVNLLYEFKNIPVVVVALAGYYSEKGLIAPAAAASASILKNTLESFGFKYLTCCQKIGEDVDFMEIKSFLDAARATKQLHRSKIASFGYACSNLYPFMYDGNLIKKYTGLDVENIDLLELEQIAGSVSKNDISDYIREFKKQVVFKNDISLTELERQAKYSIALDILISTNKYEAITMKCSSGFSKIFNFTPCMLLSYLGSKVQAICECDVYNLVLQTIISKITDFPVTFLELFEFYKNSILMAACGFAPSNVCNGGKMSVFSHEWGGSGGLMNISELNVPDEATVLNLSALNGELYIHYSKAACKKPELFQEEGWKNESGPKIPALEIEVLQGIKVFMKNITGPHYLVVFGDVSDSIEKYAYLNSINIIN